MPLLETKGAASAQGFGEFAKVGAANYIEDVFSTWLYTGNDSTNTITNGIDLSTKGGLVWLKSRSAAYNHILSDTARGAAYTLNSNNTSAQTNSFGDDVSSFSTTGFSIGGNAQINNNGSTFASWTFRKQPKFFDIVTYTGNGANRTIAHSLGSVPGCIIVKRTDTTGDWQVYHRSLANTEYMVLNSTAAKATGTTRWNSATPTSTEFSLGTDASVNANGGSYVAYLFAHDAGGFGLTGSDNVVTCGSFTNSTANAEFVSLGYEPQWILYKKTNSATDSNWAIADNLRGLSVSGNNPTLAPNLSNAEGAISSTYFYPTSTGFFANPSAAAGDTYIYIAIRRGPMKTPTDATKVFTPTVYTGTNVDNRLVDTTIAPDMVWVRQRDDTVLGGMVVGDRLRAQPYLLTGTNAAEVNDADAFDKQLISTTEYGTAFTSMNGFWCGNDATAKLNTNTTSNNHIAEAFKRAPGFFDVVCYTGTGSATTQAHNLGVVPELMIVKRRSLSADGVVYLSTLGATKHLRLFSATLGNSGELNTAGQWNDTIPTASVFSVGNNPTTNTSGETYVAYLFASCPGVSKVGSYTGNGSSQTIDMGFTGGARFFLVKRTDSTGDWWVYDSARGIVANSDPALALNSTAAEVTSADAVDTASVGLIVNQESTCNINVNGATYIYLGIA